MSDSEHEISEKPLIEDLGNPDVTTKYRAAGDILNECMSKVCDLCKPGASIYDLCSKGDKMVEEKCGAIYNKKEKGRKIEKGIAFPTCISCNEICGNFSPLSSEDVLLAAGDVVKIDMGVHIDGYICVAAYTFVIGEDKIVDRKADVLKAGYTAMEAAIRLIKPGKKNTEVTTIINKCAEEFDCNVVQGVLSHQMKRYVIDGNKVILSKEVGEDKVDEFEFELNEVYGLDILISTGEGKTKEADLRTCVYKRAVEMSYNLKSAGPRQFLSEVNKRFPTLPFAIRAIEDEKISKLGITECMRHELLHPYPVLKEKTGELVVQFKSTVLLLPGGTKKITGLPFSQQPIISSTKEVKDEELKALLATPIIAKKKKEKKVA